MINSTIKEILNIFDTALLKCQAIMYLIFAIGFITGMVGAAIDNDTVLYIGGGCILFGIVSALISQLIDTIQHMGDKQQ